MFKELKNYIDFLEIDSIPEERKVLLQSLSGYIETQLKSKKPVRLNFICTHNSRRSHLGQIWAQTMAHYYQLNNVQTYSGGTEATAMFSQIIKTLKISGFEISTLHDSNNPINLIRLNAKDAPIVGFSKVYNHFYNPQSEFIAIMTCDHASQNCPWISGAETRFNLNYLDPKIADNTEDMENTYRERSQQIATEMKYLFHHVKHSI